MSAIYPRPRASMDLARMSALFFDGTRITDTDYYVLISSAIHQHGAFTLTLSRRVTDCGRRRGQGRRESIGVS